MERAGLAVHPVSMAGRSNLAAIAPLARLIRSSGIDLVHFHGTRAGLPGLAAARIAGSAALYTVHGWACHQGRGSLAMSAARAFERTIAHGADVLICVSQADLAVGLRFGLVNPERSRVIANGVDPARCDASERRQEQRSQLGLSPRSQAIGLVGRLTHQKGQRLLLNAAPGILARHPEARFVLVGDGEDRELLTALAAHHGLADRVLFAGPRLDVPALMAALDVFVLPSYWEGMPISLLEAMAAGKPVIASRVNGSAEAIADGKTGLLVPPGDAPALGAAICRILGDPALAARIGEAARREVNERYHVVDMISSVASLYEALAAARRIRARTAR